MGYIADWFHLHGFISDSVSRNTSGVEKAFYFELRKCTSTISPHVKLLGHEFEEYAWYGLSDTVYLNYVLT